MCHTVAASGGCPWRSANRSKPRASQSVGCFAISPVEGEEAKEEELKKAVQQLVSLCQRRRQTDRLFAPRVVMDPSTYLSRGLQQPIDDTIRDGYGQYARDRVGHRVRYGTV